MGKRELANFTQAPPPSSSDSEESHIDRTNNISQKERTLSKSGVTREKYMAVIAAALVAKKKVEMPDEQGNYRWVEIDDAARQQWGAEQAAKLFGDMIERKEIEHDIGDKTLEKFKSMSVAQLRSRAAEILLNKKSRILSADVPQVHQDAETVEALPEPIQTQEEEF